jgi:ethanolamine utilization cobalamin adenosyltransferase
MINYITEAWLREKFGLAENTEVQLPANSLLTPSARELLEVRKIRIKYIDESGRTFFEEKHVSGEATFNQVNPLTSKDNWRSGQCMLCHQTLSKKPDTLTHLNENDLVAKNDARLKLRGKLDMAIAYMVWIQTEFEPNNHAIILSHYLSDIRSSLGNVLRAEVTGETMMPVVMGEFDEHTLHAISHNPLKYLGYDHLLPEVSQGKQVARLNVLRAMIREAELYAADIYIAKDFTVTRPDIMANLNRLSSAVYVMMLLVFLAERGQWKPTRNDKTH